VMAEIEMNAAKQHTKILDTLSRAGGIVLATAPVTIPDWQTAEPGPRPPAAIEVTPAQKEESGTRRASRKRSEPVEAVPPGETITYDAPSEPTQWPPKAPAAEAAPVVEATPANEAPAAPKVAITYTDEAQQAELREMFIAAGMTPGDQHTFMRSIWESHPGTLIMVTTQQYAALKPLLAGKIRDRVPPTPAAIETPEVAPVVDEDPIVTDTEAAEVRSKASELSIPAGEARAILRRYFKAEALAGLRRSQARELVDTIFAKEAALLAEAAF